VHKSAAEHVMIWQDLLLDRWVDRDALSAATASAFKVSADKVAVVDAPEQLLAISPSARIILERGRQYRDFPLQIMVVVRDDALVMRFSGEQGVLHVARTLAGQLGATVLFAEGPLSPSEWVRVRPTGDVDVVSLDVDETGEIDSFFVVGERALADGQVESAPNPTRLTA
jgi:hypothetical protein